MFNSNYAWLVLFVACLIVAYEGHYVHEKRDYTPETWIRKERVEGDTVLPFRIGLTQSNLDKGHDMLMEVSDPTSLKYGKYYTEQEVIDIFAPSTKSIAAVRKWLEDFGFDSRNISQSQNKQWIQLDATVRQFESLLRTELHHWYHEGSNELHVACDQYWLPAALSQHVDYVLPGIRLMTRQRYRPHMSPDHPNIQPSSDIMVPKNMRQCAHNLSPKCIRAAYNIPRAKLAHPGNQIGFYEAAGIIFSQQDFAHFVRKLNLSIPQHFAPKFLSVDGADVTAPRPPTKQYPGDSEANLDVDIAVPMIYPQGYKIYQIPPLPEGGTPKRPARPGLFNLWLDAIDGSYCDYTAFGITGDSPKIDPKYKKHECGVFKPTNVISISYGIGEDATPANYAKRQCSEYMKLGMRGITVAFCTQDEGAGAGIGSGRNYCYRKTGDVFLPNFPATCPYVLSVGSTVYRNNSDITDHRNERGIDFSGGGFSNFFETPSYQRKAVKTFLTKHKPPYKSYSAKNGKHVGANGGIYNRNGRGIPDVSSAGQYILTVQLGKFRYGSGTSASTPTWAGILNLINEERLAKGKSTIGFVNPVLYKHPEAMHDITAGHNWNCGLMGIGFNCTKGWDPVTGLGSPNYPKLLDLFLKLP